MGSSGAPVLHSIGSKALRGQSHKRTVGRWQQVQGATTDSRELRKTRIWASCTVCYEAISVTNKETQLCDVARKASWGQ